MKDMRFRQIHLDFHASPLIPGIGEAFDKREWQDMLKLARANSITCFSCCHHGMSYHPTEIGQMHPGLKFNLLRAQIDASHEIGVNVPIYLTAGINNVAAERHPEWREVNFEGRFNDWNPGELKPGFRTMCFNSPYLDWLCCLVDEAVAMFPDADGVFLDIISQGQCCCKYCLHDMLEEGYDPEKEEDRIRFSRRTLMKYYRRTTETVRKRNPDMPIFHNSGAVKPGRREILPYFSHLELESLPTGGWGYDHYPLSAAYCRGLGMEFLGMTGKFHTTWGEFGGFKHPNALRYECAAMLAQGSKCSIGDQLHPSCKLDESTCRLIGAAYAEVEAKEPWCRRAAGAATTALLSNMAFMKLAGTGHTSPASETGASRMLQELHIPFDLLDREMSFDRYETLVLADDLRIDDELRTRLQSFLAKGGKLILSHDSLLKQDEDKPAFDLPIDYEGENPLFPDYVRAAEAFAPDFVKTPFVMYRPSKRIRVKGGVSLGQVFDPYFDRTYRHFCSHQHTPYKPEPSGFDAGVLSGNILYFAHPVFALYAAYGAVALKHFVGKAVDALLGNRKQVRTDLPSQGRVSLLHQPEEKRYILHLLYANTILRGSAMEMNGGNVRDTRPIAVIEELNALPEVTAEIRIPAKVRRVTLAPQGTELPLEAKDGYYTVRLQNLCCHQMVVFDY